MRTLFERDPWRPSLGQYDWIPSIITAGAGIYQGILKERAAEEAKEAAEALAAAERAKLDAERARVAAEKARAAAETQEAIAAEAQAAITAGPTILGIPRDYLILGGVGLGAIAAIVALSR
jgi:hypothetical protein